MIFKNVFAEGFPPHFTRIRRTLILQLQASCFPGSSTCIQLGEKWSIYVTGTVTEHISHTQQNSVYWPWLKFSFPHFLCQVIPQRAEASHWFVCRHQHFGCHSLEALTLWLFYHWPTFILCTGKTSESKLVYGKGNNGEMF